MQELEVCLAVHRKLLNIKKCIFLKSDNYYKDLNEIIDRYRSYECAIEEAARISKPFKDKIKQFPQLYQEILINRYMNCQEYSEIANTLGVTERRVRALHNKAVRAYQNIHK